MQESPWQAAMVASLLTGDKKQLRYAQSSEGRACGVAYLSKRRDPPVCRQRAHAYPVGASRVESGQKRARDSERAARVARDPNIILCAPPVKLEVVDRGGIHPDWQLPLHHNPAVRDALGKGHRRRQILVEAKGRGRRAAHPS
eukprot:6194598-Pleurochrysis_carterae.AAC.2